MDRRYFLSGAGLVAAGAIPGAVAGFAAEPVVMTEGPTARTAVPAGLTAARVATVNSIASRMISLAI